MTVAGGRGGIGRGSGRRRAGRRGQHRRAFVTLLAVTALVSGLGLWSRSGLPAGLSHRLYPVHYRREIVAAADRYGLDPYLVAAVVKAESNFDPEAVSRAGAVGLMQLMPATAAWIVQQSDWTGVTNPDLRDPEHNLALGTYYLAYLLKKFGGDEAAALAAYNAGQGVVSAWLAVPAAGDAWRPPATLRSEDIPFPETRRFVARVERFRTIYTQAHPSLIS
ncbi:MAG: hypothetical protein Kow00122_18640 [Thermoleophilia bacterium]